ncbi:MAG: glycosyl transferase, group 1 [Hyphomicrobiales bacterium]|nr:glycosyl transferase, group 1 [Hyphomicrobiales bacterium]
MQVIGDLETLHELAPAWWDLWRRDARATPFQSPAWLIPWWRAFSPGRLHVAAVWQDDRLAALAPLYIEEATGRLLPIGISLSDSLDLIAENPSAAQQLMQALLLDCPCARLDLEPVAAGAHARAAGGGKTWTCREEHTDVSPVLPLGPTWDAHVPARKRRQWRRAVREAQAHGDMRLEQVESHPAAFLGHLGRLHRARWETRSEEGVLADETVQRFQSLAAPELLRAGLARFYLLHFAGCVTGAYYGMAAKSSAFAYIGGFDPAFSHESPGTILLAHAMTQAHDEGARRFEFLRGAEPYKFAWGAHEAPLYRRIWERRP